MELMENDREILPEEQMTPADALPEENENTAEKLAETLAETEKLKDELATSKIKISLLLAGIIGEKLEEGAALAKGLCIAGKTPEQAAAEIILEYPHLRAVRNEIPQFAAGSSGSGDGFSAIRRIFSGR